jgi:NAD(P)-dependent dehydrogenase (short-subunit alcohol dehydrogenase family)
MKIDNAVVLVTGANRGLGRALAMASLKAGARRVYVGARDPNKLDTLLRQAPDRLVALPLDVTDARSLEAAAASAPDITMLINNAGILASHDVLTSTPEQIAQDFATNFFGLIGATKAFLPALERSGAGGGAALVNVLSVVSLANMPALGSYSASKAAAFSITQALRRDLATRRITVHGVFAGPIDTDMIRGMEMEKTSPEEVARAILAGVEQGLEDITPDPFSVGVLATWKRDPKELERQFGS